MQKILYHFTPEIIEELIRLYPHTKTKELAEKWNFSMSAVYKKARELNLKKDIECVRVWSRENSGREDHPSKKFLFQKGFVPKNKGRKAHEYLSTEALVQMEKTQFKKGHTPSNTKEIGTERINEYGYAEIKTHSGYKLKHRVVWEQHNGAIPKGYNIQFKDKNHSNCVIENLYIISRAEQMKNENSVRARYPKEIQEVIMTKAVLNRHINKLLKQQKDAEQ